MNPMHVCDIRRHSGMAFCKLIVGDTYLYRPLSGKNN